MTIAEHSPAATSTNAAAHAGPPTPRGPASAALLNLLTGRAAHSPESLDAIGEAVDAALAGVAETGQTGAGDDAGL